MGIFQRFYHASIFVPQRVREIKESPTHHALADGVALLMVALFVGYSWQFAMIFEGYARIGGPAGTSELLYFLRQIVILDLLPLALLTGIFFFASGVKGVGKNLELALALWTQPLLIRLVLEGIPLLLPLVNYYPVPFVEVPQLVAYMWALLSLSFALSCCKSEKKRPEEGGGKLFAAPLSFVWAGIVVIMATVLFWYPLARSVPLFVAAPTFVLPSEQGTCDLAAQKGKVVVLEFWNYRCHHCRRQAEEMATIADSVDPEKVTLFAVHTSGGAEAREAAAKVMHHKNVRLCFDDGSVSTIYREIAPYHRLHGIPHTMILDRHGVIRKVYRGRKDAAVILGGLKQIVAR